LVSEKPNLVSEKSGKSQGILFICGAGNPAMHDHFSGLPFQTLSLKISGGKFRGRFSRVILVGCSTAHRRS